MSRIVQKKFIAPLVLATIIFSLSLGILTEGHQSSTSENNPSEFTTPDSIKNEKVLSELAALNSEERTNAKIIYIDNDVSTSSSEPVTLNNTISETPVFQVMTDYKYECRTGNPKTAIENAIDSLPNNRTEPLNIYLEGTFDPVYDIVLENNLNFVGKNAILVSGFQESIFILNQTGTYSEVYATFELNGLPYVDWYNLHNVTFQSIYFKQPFEMFDNRYAINFFEKNSTGWGVSNNLSIYNCTFEGFVNCVQGLAFKSEYVNNNFRNYSNNGLLLLYGFDISIQKNIFESSTSPISVEEYASMYGPGSMVGCIGLFLLDVCDTVVVSNNLFIQGTNSTGLAFSSSIGNYIVTDNTFTGQGAPYLIDFNERPFLSDGIVFSDNIGVQDFSYNNGVYSYRRNILSSVIL